MRLVTSRGYPGSIPCVWRVASRSATRFLRALLQVDWLEIISDNDLVDGGKPLVLLDQIGAHYPIVMHGIAMSMGASQRVGDAHPQRVKALADRLQPLGISDHLCGIGSGLMWLREWLEVDFWRRREADLIVTSTYPRYSFSLNAILNKGSAN